MTTRRIITRDEWGARHENGFGFRTVGSLDKFLHHSVTQAPDLVAPFDDDFAAIRYIESIGEQRFKRGISYSFLFTPAGLIFEGVSVDRIGAHTSGHNTTGTGWCLVGNYQGEPPTPQQEDSIAWLLNHGVARRWWKYNALTGGHRDKKSTACPGDKAYARIPAINELADGERRLHVPVVRLPKPNPVAPPFPLPRGWYFGWKKGPRQSVSGYYSHRTSLRKWQQRMKDRGWNITPDGLYGPETHGVTVRFQAEKGLQVDGRIGPITWDAAWTAPVT